MGGGGRGEATSGAAAGAARAGDGCADESASARAGARDGLFGPPGAGLAWVIEAQIEASVVGPGGGGWPLLDMPRGSSTDPWRDVVHGVVAARRLQGWASWVEVALVGRLLLAWRPAPAVSNEAGVTDRCGEADPALVERLNREIIRVQRSLRGQWAGQAGALAPELAAAEMSLACGLSRTLADRQVEAAEALIVQGRLPRLRRLLRAGWVERYKLDTFVAETAHLEAVIANAVERLVLGDTERHRQAPTAPTVWIPRVATPVGSLMCWPILPGPGWGCR